MSEERKPDTTDEQPWTRSDEENLLLEISEDRRLIRLGIDPDGTPLEVLLQLKKRAEQIKKQKSQRPHPTG